MRIKSKHIGWFENRRFIAVIDSLDLWRGEAGAASTHLLLSDGVTQIIGCDRGGIVYKGRKENMNPMKEKIAGQTNPERINRQISNVLEGSDSLTVLGHNDSIFEVLIQVAVSRKRHL